MYIQIEYMHVSFISHFDKLSRIDVVQKIKSDLSDNLTPNLCDAIDVYVCQCVISLRMK